MIHDLDRSGDGGKSVGRRRGQKRNGCAFGVGKPSNGHVRLRGTFNDPDLDLHPVHELAVIELLLDGDQVAADLDKACRCLLRMLVAVYVINLGYGFEGSWQQLGEYRFKSHALTGAPAGDRRFEAGNRFADTRLGSLPVPFPKNYVQGIDTQKVDFEHGMRSYLRGQWSERGWWYFYLYALAVKVPLGTWALVVLAMAITVFPGRRAVRWRDEILVLLPLAVILILVSSQTGFSIHFRYVVPIFPFLFIWASKAFCMSRARAGVLADGEVQANRTDDPSPPRETGHGDWIGLGEGIGQPSSDERGQDPCPPQGQGRVRVGRARGFLATAALAWAITGSLWYYPHSLSYFNELVGGPEHGHEHLLDSSIACGQNLLYLKEWYDAHPDARPLRLAAFGTIDPLLAGIEFTVPATSVAKPRSADQANEGRTDIQPGWYAIDVNYLHGSGRPAAGGGGRDGQPRLPGPRVFPSPAAGRQGWCHNLHVLDTSWRSQSTAQRR